MCSSHILLKLTSVTFLPFRITIICGSHEESELQLEQVKIMTHTLSQLNYMTSQNNDPANYTHEDSEECDWGKDFSWDPNLLQSSNLPSSEKHGSLIFENCCIVVLQILNKCTQAIVPNWDKQWLKINAHMLNTWTIKCNKSDRKCFFVVNRHEQPNKYL